jgi:electron transport complex protein RnfC
MGLNPTAYAKAMNVEDKADRSARLIDAKINLCIECGCCSYACPSRRPLVETNRLAKADLRDYQAKKKEFEAKEKEATK